MQGKLADKLRSEPTTSASLAHYYHSARAGRGLLEPLYRLHASRLKALFAAPPGGEPPPAELMAALVRGCFRPDTQQVPA
eukprot:1412388-Pyramimonas_sp.AAC.1